MGYENGRIPTSALTQIHHPWAKCYLQDDAAAAWEDMRQESLERWGIDLYPAGPNSAYRTYGAQVYFRNLYLSGRGALAAVPGTSNHGWGKAVDLAETRMRWVVNQIGHKYGWRKVEAFSEWWHVNYVGGAYKRRTKKRGQTLKRGDRGPGVHALQTLLRYRTYPRLGRRVRYFPWKRSGTFGPLTARAVKKFQRDHKLTADGVVGPNTWRALGVRPR